MVAFQGTARLSPRGWQSSDSAHSGPPLPLCKNLRTWPLAGTQTAQERRMGRLGHRAAHFLCSKASLHQSICSNPAAQHSHTSSKYPLYTPVPSVSLLTPSRPCKARWTLHCLAVICWVPASSPHLSEIQCTTVEETDRQTSLPHQSPRDPTDVGSVCSYWRE